MGVKEIGLKFLIVFKIVPNLHQNRSFAGQVFVLFFIGLFIYKSSSRDNSLSAVTLRFLFKKKVDSSFFILLVYYSGY